MEQSELGGGIDELCQVSQIFFGGVECLNVVAASRMMMTGWFGNNGIVSE